MSPEPFCSHEMFGRMNVDFSDILFGKNECSYFDGGE